jgi:hypothetical protein
MDKLIESSIIKGIVFSAFDKLGPQPIYMFPQPLEVEDLEKLKEDDRNRNILAISLRDYTQIAIKNINLIKRLHANCNKKYFSFNRRWSSIQ